MNTENEIIAWLESDRNFDEGLSLFAKYSRNRAVYLWLGRKRNMPKLVYELEKLSKLKFLKVKIEQASAKKTIQSGQANKAPRRIAREDVPEGLLDLFDNKIPDAYKLQRVIHEKMKLAQTDEDRSALRAELVKLDDFIAASWDKIEAAIDGSVATATDPKPGEDAPKAEYTLINNARSNITRMLKKYDASKKAKLLEHVNTLIKHKATIKQATYDKLLELDVIDQNTNILVK